MGVLGGWGVGGGGVEGSTFEQRPKMSILGLLAAKALSAAGEVVGRAGRAGPVTRPLPLHHTLGPAHIHSRNSKER